MKFGLWWSNERIETVLMTELKKFQTENCPLKLIACTPTGSSGSKSILMLPKLVICRQFWHVWPTWFQMQKKTTMKFFKCFRTSWLLNGTTMDKIHLVHLEITEFQYGGKLKPIAWLGFLGQSRFQFGPKNSKISEEFHLKLLQTKVFRLGPSGM